jgi:hypothetical protein
VIFILILVSWFCTISLHASEIISNELGWNSFETQEIILNGISLPDKDLWSLAAQHAPGTKQLSTIAT